MISGPFLNKRVSQEHKGFLFGNAAHLQEALFLEVRMTLRTVWPSVIKVMWQKVPKTSRENEGGGPVSAGRDYLLPKENKSQPRSQRKAPITRGQEFSVKKDHKSIPQHELGHFVSRLLFLAAFILLILSLVASTPMFPSYLIIFPPSQRKTGNIWCHQVKVVPVSKEDINFQIKLITLILKLNTKRRKQSLFSVHFNVWECLWGIDYL